MGWIQAVEFIQEAAENLALYPPPGGAGMDKEARILNRLIEYHNGIGVSMEADPRHCEALIRDTGAESLKAVSTPVVREEVPECEEAKENDIAHRKRSGTLSAKLTSSGVPLEGKDITRFRGLAARAKFLSIDRPDNMYASKELTRAVATPTQSDW